ECRMAEGIFNNARGRIRELIENGSNDLIVVLLKDAEADADLQDHDTLADLLNAGGNTEADFTNYSRKVIDNGDISIDVDDDNEQLDIDFPDPSWPSAGNGTNNTL